MTQAANHLYPIALGACAVIAAQTFAYLDLRGRIDGLRLEVARGTSAPGTPEATVTTSEARPADAIVIPAKATDEHEEVTPGGDWACKGHISTEMARTAAGRYGPDVFQCYRERLEAEPDLAGLATLDVRVGADGRPTTLRWSGHVDDADFHRCVTERSRQWSFPRPVDGACAVLRWPFDLSPTGATPDRAGL